RRASPPPAAGEASRRPGARRSRRLQRPPGAARRGSGLLVRPVPLGLSLHPLETLVVVGELLHDRECELARGAPIVRCPVRLRVVRAVLELDVHACPELLEVEPVPVDADRIPYALGFLGRCPVALGHLQSPMSWPILRLP